MDSFPSAGVGNSRRLLVSCDTAVTQRDSGASRVAPSCPYPALYCSSGTIYAAWLPTTQLWGLNHLSHTSLDLFRDLNVVGNISVHDFVGTLERRTDATRLGDTPESATTKNPFEAVGAGELATACWACPEPDFNLPEDWALCPPEDKFLYSLLLALDANFRLKNRIRANERKDPSLGSGWGYFVENDAYKEHLRDYVAETDVSTCIAFAALMQKETRLTTGLRVSGVGGCVCGRHGVVRAQGLGDLQKGERYANMDYILMHALGDTRVWKLVLSYDIACQWKQRLLMRVADMVKEGGVKSLDDFESIQFALPVWHAAAHDINCREALSSSHAPGVGRTDGEGIERTWVVLNPIGFATKEMGEGNRHDTIEDKVDHLNFEKNVGQGENFTGIDCTLEPALRDEWQAYVEEWQADSSKPNLYVVAGGKEAGPSEAEVAAELKKSGVEEAREGRGEFIGEATTAVAFVKGLMQLEAQKRRIKAEIKGKTVVTAEPKQPNRRAPCFVLQEIEDHPTASGSLHAWRVVKAEDVKLWFAADLTESQRKWACKKGVVTIEAKLRRAQCGDALTKIHSLLYSKTHLVYSRNEFSVGQLASTRANTLIGRVSDELSKEVGKYRQALIALKRLEGPNCAPEFRELLDSDLNVRSETESDAALRRQLGRIGSSRPA
ncbi:hypothetical protein MIND_01114200 [Mycena indigotica]|uniref:Uncharacterized protein n=1 Tax=Mycena indigotica TaxID=2126181 RepID=A0A8H6S5R7_9AGAR|nr:uncharacterized protein MIND_01114200 [Mycena indigotica]KAF7293374.1 hypothetical protein MIND_01114200 [Mycena indigotica]